VLDHLGKPRIRARERDIWERPFRALARSRGSPASSRASSPRPPGTSGSPKSYASISTSRSRPSARNA
jgi:hypothetical protein